MNIVDRRELRSVVYDLSSNILYDTSIINQIYHNNSKILPITKDLFPIAPFFNTCVSNTHKYHTQVICWYLY